MCDRYSEVSRCFCDVLGDVRFLGDVLALFEEYTINLVDYNGSCLWIPRDVALKVGQVAVLDDVVVSLASLVVLFGTIRIIFIGNGIGH